MASARLLARRGQGHAASQGDLRTAILAARGALPPRMNAKRVSVQARGSAWSWPPHHVERDGLMRIAAEAANL